MAETEAAKRFSDTIDAVIEDVSASCKADKDKYCSSVTPGEGRLLHCALAHEDKLGQTCFNSLFDAVAELKGLLQISSLPLRIVAVMRTSFVVTSKLAKAVWLSA